MARFFYLLSDATFNPTVNVTDCSFEDILISGANSRALYLGRCNANIYRCLFKEDTALQGCVDFLTVGESVTLNMENNTFDGPGSGNGVNVTIGGGGTLAGNHRNNVYKGLT